MAKERSSVSALKHGLPPVARADARLLILGSLPGDASLAAERYYAHPQNHFWRLLEEVTGKAFPLMPYPERLERLQEQRIALWDVVASARRPGSLDTDLRDVAVRDLPGLVRGLPQLRAVAFNGGTAARLGRKSLAGTPIDLVDLPSSSPAYTLPIAGKAERWLVLRAYL